MSQRCETYTRNKPNFIITIVVVDVAPSRKSATNALQINIRACHMYWHNEHDYPHKSDPLGNAFICTAMTPTRANAVRDISSSTISTSIISNDQPKRTYRIKFINSTSDKHWHDQWSNRLFSRVMFVLAALKPLEWEMWVRNVYCVRV